MRISRQFREFLWTGFPEDKKSPENYNILEKRDFLSHYIKGLDCYELKKFFSYLVVTRDDVSQLICASLAQLFDRNNRALTIADVIMSECFEYFIDDMEDLIETEYKNWFRACNPPIIFPQYYKLEHPTLGLSTEDPQC